MEEAKYDMKKLMALLLVLTLGVTMFTACSKKKMTIKVTRQNQQNKQTK